MSKIFGAVFLIFGTVVGAGFSSGKEIMVFFSRYGVLSYLYILIAGILFFLLFYFLLLHGKSISKHIENSKILNFVMFVISIVFCSSMFAGINNLFSYLPIMVYVLLTVGLILGCVLVCIKGMKGLEKANLVLMPAMSIIFFAVLFFACFSSSKISISTNSWAGFLYCPLYVSLNISMSSVVISKIGENLTKKQAFYVSLFSTILILIFLLFGNFVLQKNNDSFVSEMPFLNIVKNNPLMFVLSYVVILIGCFTTLISLCLTLKTSFQVFIKNEMIATLCAVLIPFVISAVGFSQIVSLLYPICSVFGVFVLAYIVAFENGKIVKDKVSRKINGE